MFLTLARHGETDWNNTHQHLGSTDLPLNARGEAQAAALAQALAKRHFDAIFASDLSRTRYTAQQIARYHSQPIQFDARLREINFGDWEGLTHAQAQARDPEALARWDTDPDYPTPDGESLNAFAERIKPVLGELQAAYTDDQTVLVVTHKGVIRLIMCLLLGIPLSNYWQFNLETAALCELGLYEKGAILNKFNDTSHLAE